MTKSGRRTDIEDIKSMVKAKRSIKEISEKTVSFQQLKFAKLFHEIHQSPTGSAAPLVISTRGLYWLTNYVHSMCCLGTCCDITI